MDPNVSFARKIKRNADSVVLLSTFLVRPEHVDDFLVGFQKQFAIMRKQPGFISAQLHRGIAGSCLFMNYVVWEFTDAFKRGYELQEFQNQLKHSTSAEIIAAAPTRQFNAAWGSGYPYGTWSGNRDERSLSQR